MKVLYSTNCPTPNTHINFSNDLGFLANVRCQNAYYSHCPKLERNPQTYNTEDIKHKYTNMRQGT